MRSEITVTRSDEYFLRLFEMKDLLKGEGWSSHTGHTEIGRDYISGRKKQSNSVTPAARQSLTRAKNNKEIVRDTASRGHVRRKAPNTQPSHGRTSTRETT